jgi:hypothetical protein
MPAEWILDDLVARVDVALTAAGYPGAPNGRVRDVPDRRAIRWYTTIGLLDRPAAMRGRTALYGPRHLTQLVAIKRRQAEGRTLAEIQAELVGASDAALREIAGVPDEVLAPAPAPHRPPGPAAPAPVAPAPPGQSASAVPAPVASAPSAPPAPAPAGRARAFWARPAAAPTPTPEPRAADEAALLTGVPLDGGAVLLLPAVPDHDDVAALRAAAQPLIDLLTARGLLAGTLRRSST